MPESPDRRSRRPKRRADAQVPDEPLGGVDDEPEPPWVEDLRRERLERAERLRELLGPGETDQEPPA